VRRLPAGSLMGGAESAEEGEADEDEDEAEVEAIEG